MLNLCEGAIFMWVVLILIAAYIIWDFLADSWGLLVLLAVIIIATALCVHKANDKQKDDIKNCTEYQESKRKIINIIKLFESTNDFFDTFVYVNDFSHNIYLKQNTSGSNNKTYNEHDPCVYLWIKINDCGRLFWMIEQYSKAILNEEKKAYEKQICESFFNKTCDEISKTIDTWDFVYNLSNAEIVDESKYDKTLWLRMDYVCPCQLKGTQRELFINDLVETIKQR